VSGVDEQKAQLIQQLGSDDWGKSDEALKSFAVDVREGRMTAEAYLKQSVEKGNFPDGYAQQVLDDIPAKGEEINLAELLGEAVAKPKPIKVPGSVAAVFDKPSGEIRDPAKRTYSANDLTQVPGLVGDLVDWMERTAHAPNRLMALAASLSTVGKLCDQKVVGPTGSGTVLYVLTLASTGAGKEHQMERIKQALEAAGEGDKIGPADFASIQAIQELVVEQPSSLAIIDEFGNGFLYRITHGTQLANVQAIISQLSSLWGKEPNSTYYSPKKKGCPVVSVKGPALSIFAVATPGQVYDAIKLRMIADGFLNRFVIFNAGRGSEAWIANPAPKEVPFELKTRLMTLATEPTPKVRAIDGSIKFAQLTWGAGAEELFLAYNSRIRGIELEDKRDLWIRAPLNAVRIATIVVVGSGRTLVEVTDLEWAIRLVDQSMKKLEDDLKKNLREQMDFGDLCKHIINLLRGAGGVIKNAELRKKLQNHVRGGAAIDDALGHLQKSNQIVCHTVEKVDLVTLMQW
jgi:hypothetical protein